MAHTDPHKDHAVPVDASAGHELTDANLAGVNKIIISMVVILAIAFGLMWLLFGYFTRRAASEDVKPSPVFARKGDRVPPGPRLQTAPVLDLKAFRKSEDAQLHAWAWVDKERGVAQIPVERAIEILAAQGLPAQPPTQAAPHPPAGAPAPRGVETPVQQPRGQQGRR